MRVRGHILHTIAVNHAFVCLTVLVQQIFQMAENIRKQLIEKQLFSIRLGKFILSKRNLEVRSLGRLAQNRRHVLQLHVHVTDVLQEGVAPRKEAVHLEIAAGALPGQRVEPHELGDGIQHAKRGEPGHELLHRENLRREHRLPPVPFGKTLQQIPLRTPVRQNHRHIVQRNASIAQNFPNNLRKKS